jgi:hypothetical protein
MRSFMVLFSGNESKENGMGSPCVVYAYRILAGKPLGEPRRRWEDCIKIGKQDEAMGGFNWLTIWTSSGVI